MDVLVNGLLVCNAPAALVAGGDAPVEFLEAAADGAEPRLPRFSGVAYSGGVAIPRGFGRPIVFDLAGVSIPEQRRPVHRDHATSQLVGHTEKIDNDGRRIRVDGLMSAANSHQQEIVASAGNGVPWKLSVGLLPEANSIEFVEAGQKVEVNGRWFKGPIHVARKTTYYETSFVTVAGDDKTSVAIAAALSQGSEPMNFEQWLQAKGFTLADLSDAQKKFLQAAFDAEQNPPDPKKPAGGGDPQKPAAELVTWLKAKGFAWEDLQDEQRTFFQAAFDAERQQPQTLVADLTKQLREAAAAETKRQSEIKRICAEHGGPLFTVQNREVALEAHAIAENWDVQKTELECLRESRARGPAVQAHSHAGRCTLEAMQGALMLRNGMALDAKHWQTPAAFALELPEFLRRPLNDADRNKFMEAAHRFADMSLVDMAREAIRLDGRYAPHGVQQIIQAAFSGSSLANIFTANVNARMLASYMEYPDSTPAFTKVDMNVPDYKLNERFRMFKGSGLKKLQRGGTAEHDERSDKKEEYRLARYSRQFVVDDMDIRDDAYSALNDIPAEMGQAGARLRPDLVYSILLGNPDLADGNPLFDATHGNDGEADLDDAGLKAAITALRTQQESGVNIQQGDPTIVVPEALSFTADGLIASAEVRAVSTTGGPTMNTIRGRVRQRVADARLDNGVTDPDSGDVHAGSDTTWFLVNPAGHTIEVGFLRGSGGAPSIRRFNLDKGQYGVGWDCQHSIGAKALDHLSMLRRTEPST